MAEPNREPRERPRAKPDAGTRAAGSHTGTTPKDEPDAAPAARPRAERYLVARLPSWHLPYGSGPEETRALAEQLDKDESFTVLRTITPQHRTGAGPTQPYPTVLVVETSPERATALAATPGLHVEVDQPLLYGDAGIVLADPGTTGSHEDVTVTFSVVDDDARPLAGAGVYLLSAAVPGYARTDANGRARLTVPAQAVTTAGGVYVQPRADCWSTWVSLPQLSVAEENPLVCRRIGDPGRYRWSARAMGFDRLPPTYRGHGVRIGLIDSGVSTAHPDLAGRIASGHDLLGVDEKSWQEDVIGVGTHSAALIGAANGARPTGLAPEVELHAYKVQPGGRFSDLIEAIDRCLATDIDLIYLAVGSRHPSWLVAHAIEVARQAGVACVAAAGNTAAGALFPASLPGVLSVAAVGALGTYPPESYHATQPVGLSAPDGLFSPRFTGQGPQIDVCAPGVAVVSAAAPGGVTAIDGTAVAAAHVAALAALVLAHHPEFRAYRNRDAARVDQLFHIIRSSCRPVGLPEPGRTGAGLPDAVAAVGLVPTPVPAHLASGAPWTAPPPGQASPLPSFATVPGLGSASGDPLAPLRAALHAAGLITTP